MSLSGFGKGCVIHMYNIAVIGDRQSVIGFKALGLDVHPVEREDHAIEVFKNLARDEQTAIIYLTERLHAALATEIEKYKESMKPAVILIPDKNGSLGLGQTALQKAVEQAVGGADIL